MAYLIDNPPKIDQFAPRTRWAKSRPTGLVVLHTAEGVMDTVGPDTGAEATAEFIRNRTSYGSYHDLVDSDSVVSVVPYELAAYQDGTGSNGFGLSISFACKTSDWRAMSAEKRRGFLRNGARAFARQQAWLKANGYPTTPLQLVSKVASDLGAAGLIYHGFRDPARRTDPGIAPPNQFPLDEFIEECRAALAGTLPEEDEMASEDVQRLLDMVGAIHHMTVPEGYRGPRAPVLTKLGGLEYAIHPEGGVNSQGEVVKRLRAVHGLVSDPAAFAAALTPILAEQLVPAVMAEMRQLIDGLDVDLDEGEMQAAAERAMRAVLGSLDTPAAESAGPGS